MTSTPAETMKFEMHPHLLWDVITRQAGSLGKALLEGVMNSVDAKATRIDLTITPEGFELRDDGGGFGSRDEVMRYFATFGAPHSEGDARFGRFRMGRGQLFAFAATVWRSNSSEMTVDIKKMGLDFAYAELAEPVVGCVVSGTFYELLTASEMVAAIGEVTRNCRYLEVPLLINGDIVTRDPAKKQWAHVTDEAYFDLKSGGVAGIDVYQQGVFVETIPASVYGLSGTIVTRVGHPLKVNFARNQVIRSCPLFRKILAQVGSESTKRIATRKNLDDSERDLLYSNLTKSSFLRETLGAKIFKDVRGRYWSARQLSAFFRDPDVKTLPSSKIAYTFAPQGDLVGDRVMENKEGFVFDESMLEKLGGNPEKGWDETRFKDFNGYDTGLRDATFVPFAEFVKARSSRFELIEANQLSTREKLILDAATQSAWGTLSPAAEVALGVIDEEQRYRSTRRTLRVGISDRADGWTDGQTFIAINRAFLKKLSTDARGFTDLAALLLHEYCHREDSSETHTHTPEFFQAYHDASVRSLGWFAQAALDTYLQALRRTSRAAQFARSKRAEQEAQEKIVFGSPAKADDA